MAKIKLAYYVVKFYADKNDTLKLISSNAKSQNIINACKAEKKKLNF